LIAKDKPAGRPARCAGRAEADRGRSAIDHGYDTDILSWFERQAELLRRLAAGELVNDAEADLSHQRPLAAFNSTSLFEMEGSLPKSEGGGF
jgi:hypothetical protein